MIDSRDLSWGAFREREPELAQFAETRLSRPPAFLATIRSDGRPRVHPVTLIFNSEGLFVFMEPKSPKGVDLRQRSHFALHNRIDDSAGTGGEVHVAGLGRQVEDATVRAGVAGVAPYRPADRYVLFELTVTDVGCVGYGDVTLPINRRWSTKEDSRG